MTALFVKPGRAKPVHFYMDKTDSGKVNSI